jgi:hypothetical protein
MINVKELRLGNLIEYHVTDSVDGTDEWVDNYVDYDDIGWISLQKNDERYRPKVLTEEMLVKFGVIGVGQANCYVPMAQNQNGEIKYAFTLTKELISNVFYCFDLMKEPIKIEYVHQLQNLYFALTGEEVTIKEVNE